jgi:high-affinity nickel-transport protein
VGFLFGLGFDTATEVGLLGIAATQAAQGLQMWTILVFPALFTAGMTLVDTADGVLMLSAYSWAVVHPRRRLQYNVTITAVSIVVALLIGSIELFGRMSEHFASLADSLSSLGFLIAGLFVLIWGAYAVIPLFASERD